MEAEEQFRRFLKLEEGAPQQPAEHHVIARRHLRYLLEIQLRYEERRKLLKQMLADGQGNAFETTVYCFPSLLRWNGPQAVQQLEKYLKQDPHNFSLRVALGRYRTGQGRLQEAEHVLRDCLRERPDDMPAVAAMLALLVERDNWDAVGRVVRSLPPATAQDPWLLNRIRGRHHNRHGEYEQARKCYELVLSEDSASAESQLGLAEAYKGLTRLDERREALRQAKVLANIQNLLGHTGAAPGDVEPVLEVAQLCEQIGLAEQALSMARLALRNAPQDSSIARHVTRLEAALGNN